MKKWVFFDVMGVVFKVGDDTRDLLVPFIKRHNGATSTESLEALYMDASLGKITAADFWRTAVPDGNCRTLEREYLDGELTLDEQVPQVFARLCAQYHIGLLSNDVSEWSRYLREKHALGEYLSGTVISGDVGFRKPSTEIYERALKLAECAPQDCIFIDDRVKNLYPAQALGIKVIKFNRNDVFDPALDISQVGEVGELPAVIDRLFDEYR